MSFSFPEGGSQQYSVTFASPKTISAITNANPAVCTSTAHGFQTGDEVLLQSGWEDLNDMVVKVTVTDANTFSLDDIDTTDTGFYPTGAGAGSASEISTWVPMPQVMTISASGGDPRFTDVRLLARRNAIRIPTGFEASTITLSLAHDPTNATWKSMVNISRALRKTAFRQVMGGSTTYGYGYMSCSEVPQATSGQVNQVSVVMALLGRPVSYGS
jgi:hypothetical protein